MQDRQFFGYGSLVNRATHNYPRTRPARLDGWRRVWVHTNLRPVAYLSVEKAENVIEGLVAEVPGADWAALDSRERAYDRHPIRAVLQECGSDAQAQVYAVPDSHAAAPDITHPVLLSYIDTVVQGFLEVFGEAGAKRFFATTAGWHAPILNDRAAPRYPRAQACDAWVLAFVDAHLRALAAQVHEA
ncbi:gamma-glutamylcyclotransferase family protein [Tropicimonas sp. TH_r6]|uniref:gamma-glutamylcyclotransferase family protein n=1 Tax=Tropicimonas sp. TH_r6 TaxID=3082085 RepID=UPI0029557003|nr:gamma-glutamylcyclotransferase family protein [Tropicimonas sp. TH_r6]MDV7142380.1 gamma-glutamylcyclotransferase family protein [Tropicimonas sp. TH_r6]